MLISVGNLFSSFFHVLCFWFFGLFLIKLLFLVITDFCPFLFMWNVRGGHQKAEAVSVFFLLYLFKNASDEFLLNQTT